MTIQLGKVFQVAFRGVTPQQSKEITQLPEMKPDSFERQTVEEAQNTEKTGADSAKSVASADKSFNNLSLDEKAERVQKRQKDPVLAKQIMDDLAKYKEICANFDENPSRELYDEMIKLTTKTIGMDSWGLEDCPNEYLHEDWYISGRDKLVPPLDDTDDFSGLEGTSMKSYWSSSDLSHMG